MRIISAKAIEAKTMSPEKKLSAKNDYFGFYIGRPITYYLSIPFIMADIRPNVISLISLLFAVSGWFLVSFGNFELNLIGVTCFLLWSFFDGVDGNVARFCDKTSKMGALWDDAVGYSALALMLFSMGILAFRSENYLFEIDEKYLYIVLGGMSALASVLARLVMHKKTIIFGTDAGVGLNDTYNFSMLKVLMFNIGSPSGFMLIFMYLSVCFDLCNIFTLGYALFELAILLYTFFRLLEI